MVITPDAIAHQQTVRRSDGVIAIQLEGQLSCRVQAAFLADVSRLAPAHTVLFDATRATGFAPPVVRAADHVLREFARVGVRHLAVACTSPPIRMLASTFAATTILTHGIRIRIVRNLAAAEEVIAQIRSAEAH